MKAECEFFQYSPHKSISSVATATCDMLDVARQPMVRWVVTKAILIVKVTTYLTRTLIINLFRKIL